MLKKIGYALGLIAVISASSVMAMEDDGAPEAKRVMVYSHGFGEIAYPDDNMLPGPTYPDAPGNIFKGCFYTRPAVVTLADYLQQKVVDENCTAIDLVTRSCGAGTAITTLSKLATYPENQEYFAGTRIASALDAASILAAVNEGSFELDAPLLSLKKIQLTAGASAVLRDLTVLGAVATAYRMGVFGASRSVQTVALAAAAGAGTHRFAGSYIKRFSATALDAVVLPAVTKGHYNPLHIKPIDAALDLKGRLTCPILLHCNKQDYVVDNPDEATVRLYDSLKNGKAHVLLSDDGSHNSVSLKHIALRQAFRKRYGSVAKSSFYDSFPLPGTNLDTTKLTVQQLRDAIEG